jgi:hypothetical protein
MSACCLSTKCLPTPYAAPTACVCTTITYACGEEVEGGAGGGLERSRGDGGKSHLYQLILSS